MIRKSGHRFSDKIMRQKAYGTGFAELAAIHKSAECVKWWIAKDMEKHPHSRLQD
jgi:hypothetical protein